ncbi:MAG: flagellar hook protein [Oscillospiraceae bacterium]|nr:flagellar hook protein [Oscillospiraceae bacterium]
MTIQNNLNAISAIKLLSAGMTQTKKSSEKLASGLGINRAADNAAGLAVSEKLLAQISGDYQAISNANMGISLIRTAEGALEQTSSILGRVSELTVQAANGILSGEQREFIQMEVNQLMSEVDRISKATEFNGIKLLDGSMGQNGSMSAAGMKGVFGAKYGTREFSTEFNQTISLSSNVGDVSVNFTINASGIGGENAMWSPSGKQLTINLAENGVYTDAQINDFIKNATSGGSTAPATVEFKSDIGQVVAVNASSGSTVSGVRQSTTLDLSPLMSSGAALAGFADNITFIANQYGSHTVTDGVYAHIKIVTDVNNGNEGVSINAKAQPGVAGADITLHLAKNTEYTSDSIAGYLKAAGFDYTVELSSTTLPRGNTTALFQNNAATGAPINSMDGAGLGTVGFNGNKGLTLQIGGSNSSEQRVTVGINAMDSRSIGLSGIDVTTTNGAFSAMDMVKNALNTVSQQRASLGAMENKLEYTVNSLTVKTENEIAANSRIRDTDMAKEMVNYSKNKLLEQVGMAMLAQANQIPQLMTQLLK